MKEIDLAWLAGFFDGEGTICISPQKISHHYALCISVASIDRWILEWFSLAFNGKVNRQYRAKGNKRELWFWRIVDHQGEVALRTLLPYLKLKKPQAELALEFREARSYHKGQNTVNEAELTLRESYRQKMSTLNQ